MGPLFRLAALLAILACVPASAQQGSLGSPYPGLWTTYTTTITYFGVAPTTASATAAFKAWDAKTYSVQIVFTVTTLGSGSGNVSFTLPSSSDVPPSGLVNTVGHTCSGEETATGSAFNPLSAASGSTLVLAFPTAMAARTYTITCAPFQVN